MTRALRDRASDYFRDLQDRIVDGLQRLDGTAFHEDTWDRPGGGGGRSRVLMEGQLFEKAGVNFSNVHGEMSEEFAKNIPGEGRQFTACGISLVLHPRNPFVPTVHANFRCLTKGDRQWFGGGADLTPFYPFRDDVIHFHRVWKQVCDRHATVADHARFKKWCDDYFFLPHRGEARGVGGIFFDYLEKDLEATFDFVRDAGDHFLDAYVPIAERRRNEPYSPEQKEFQEYRRGRYVEFNLVYDRGTVFGLKTGGRIESILMSLPAKARWWYDYKASPGTREAELTEYWLRPRDWLGE
ncbi:MAG: oxygen-dependent coproporphyrinogen oxidase [Gemmataceae bacterium]